MMMKCRTGHKSHGLSRWSDRSTKRRNEIGERKLFPEELAGTSVDDLLKMTGEGGQLVVRQIFASIRNRNHLLYLFIVYGYSLFPIEDPQWILFSKDFMGRRWNFSVSLTLEYASPAILHIMSETISLSLPF